MSDVTIHIKLAPGANTPDAAHLLAAKLGGTWSTDSGTFDCAKGVDRILFAAGFTTTTVASATVVPAPAPVPAPAQARVVLPPPPPPAAPAPLPPLPKPPAAKAAARKPKAVAKAKAAKANTAPKKPIKRKR